MHIRPEVREKTIKCCMSSILKGLMRHYDLGQVELSQILGVPHGRVKSWLERKKPQADWELFRCAEFFRVPITYLIYGIYEEGYAKDSMAKTLNITLVQETRAAEIERYNQ